MTFHLPPHIENSILASVHSGQFASTDEAIAAAWTAFRSQQEQTLPYASTTGKEPVRAYKPISNVFAEIRRQMSDVQWDTLPVDGAAQHDHYIYGLPKHPTP